MKTLHGIPPANSLVPTRGHMVGFGTAAWMFLGDALLSTMRGHGVDAFGDIIVSTRSRRGMLAAARGRLSTQPGRERERCVPWAAQACEHT